MPAGKGYADLIYLPRAKYPDKPAMVIELKWNKSVEGAVSQIKKKDYPASLKGYEGTVFLAGISYDRRTKKHACVIEEYSSYWEK